MDVPALRALARAGVERVEERRQIGHDVFHVDFHAMNERRAARTIPFEAVLHIGGPDLLDYEADRMVRGAMTQDYREAVAAFAEKRPPVFRGR